MRARIRVTLIQVGYGDEELPSERLVRVVEQVESLPPADLIVLPELWVHGGFAAAKWAERAEALDGTTVTRLAELAGQRGCWLHGGSIVERAGEDADPGPEGRGMWNTSLLFDPSGSLAASYRKIHRFGFGDGEPTLLEAGDQLCVTDMQLGGRETKVGLATCYDMRFPELFRGLGEMSAIVVVVPAAWPLPRVRHWQLLGQARAVENQTWVIQCNSAGTHSGLTMGGHSQVVAPTGDVVGALGAEEGVLTVDMDLDLVDVTRDLFPVLRDRRQFS